ncbi:MAG: tetratricopeptide repeat protein [Candidatus Helarchaeota archaeon]|nr:tetratricopeptide repeat protein [Candidatus Helarchaeota archaeon]
MSKTEIKIQKLIAKADLFIRKRGDYNTAIKLINEAIMLDDKNPYGWYELGGAYLATDNLQNAAVCFGKVVLINRAYKDTTLKLGYIHMKLGDMATARNFLQMAIESNPLNDVAWNTIALSYLAQGQLNEAFTHFEHVAQLNPRFKDVQYNMGVVQSALKNFDKAMLCFKAAIVVNPRDKQSYLEMGRIAFSIAKQPENAIVLLNSALNIDPNFKEALFEIGLAYMTQGNITQAQNCLRRAIGLDPNYKEAWTALAPIYAHLKQYSEAISYCQKALAIDPKFFKAWKILGEIYEEIGDAQKAKECFQRVEQFKH